MYCISMHHDIKTEIYKCRTWYARYAVCICVCMVCFLQTMVGILSNILWWYALLPLCTASDLTRTFGIEDRDWSLTDTVDLKGKYRITQVLKLVHIKDTVQTRSGFSIFNPIYLTNYISSFFRIAKPHQRKYCHQFRGSVHKYGFFKRILDRYNIHDKRAVPIRDVELHIIHYTHHPLTVCPKLSKTATLDDFSYENHRRLRDRVVAELFSLL